MNNNFGDLLNKTEAEMLKDIRDKEIADLFVKSIWEDYRGYLEGVC